MSDYATLRITRASQVPAEVPSPKYWLRIEQDQDTDLVTVTKVNKLLDELYDIEPCIVVEEESVEEEQPESEEEQPTEEKLFEAAKKTFGDDLIACRKAMAGDYTATVKVWRSHPEENYKLILSAGEIVLIEIVTIAISENIDVKDATSVELRHPVATQIAAGWLGPVIGEAGIVAPPAIKRSGNLLYWDESVTGTIRVEYGTEYDRVTVEVPGVPKYPGSDVGDSQDVKILAFYHLMVFEGEIVAPEEDETISAGALKQLCGYNKKGQLDVPEEDDEEPPLPEPPPPPQYGCQDYGWGLAEPSAYKAFCCEEKAPPTACLLRTDRHPGGKTISQDVVDHYLAINKNTEFVPVTPRGAEGCGTVFYHLRVRPKNCCEGVAPLEWDAENSADVIADNSAGVVVVTGGKLPLTVSVRGNNFYLDNNHRIRDGVVNSRSFNVFTGDACGLCTITVTDGCSQVVGVVRSPDGRWIDDPNGAGCVGGEQTMRLVNLAREITSTSGGRRQVQVVTKSPGTTAYHSLGICAQPPATSAEGQSICAIHVDEWCNPEHQDLCTSPFAEPCETTYGGVYTYDSDCAHGVQTVITCVWWEAIVFSNKYYKWVC